MNEARILVSRIFVSMAFFKVRAMLNPTLMILLARSQDLILWFRIVPLPGLAYTTSSPRGRPELVIPMLVALVLPEHRGLAVLHGPDVDLQCRPVAAGALGVLGT